MRGTLIAVLAAITMTGIVGASASAAVIPVDGDTVWIGAKRGYGGTGMFPVYVDTPADPQNPGEPDFWSYCIEHDVSALTDVEALLGDETGYLGGNYFGDPGIPGKVLWVLAHSYPALSLADFGTAVGIPGISEFDAIEATQYAIWRYTDLTFDAAWSWETQDSEDAYWYLVNGANASSGLTPGDFEATVALVGPTTAQNTSSLVGPFMVTTNQPSASVGVDEPAAIVEATGAPIDPAVFADGGEFFLDLRGTTAAGSATVTASVLGSSATGLIISVPTTPGESPTAQEHAQTQILVTAANTTTDARVVVQWAATSSPQLAQTGSEPALGGLAIVAALVMVGVTGVVVRRRAAR